MALVLQFLIPSLSASLFTPSIHLRLGLPTLLLPSGVPRVIFLHSSHTKYMQLIESYGTVYREYKYRVAHEMSYH